MSHGDDDRTDRERGQILILDRYSHNATFLFCSKILSKLDIYMNIIY